MNIAALRKNRQYAQILSRIQKHIPSAIIAGGAIRDLCHDKEVKDIDIYIPHNGKIVAEGGVVLSVHSSTSWEQIFALDGFDNYIDDTCEDKESYEGKNHISTVFEMQSDGVLYNIIMVDMSPIKYVMEHFDIGLCKTYFDGNKFHLSAEFMHDSKHGCLTITANKKIKQREFDHMFEWHVAKLQRKYQDFIVIVPERFEAMYKNFIKRKVK